MKANLFRDLSNFRRISMPFKAFKICKKIAKNSSSCELRCKHIVCSDDKCFVFADALNSCELNFKLPIVYKLSKREHALNDLCCICVKNN